MEPTQEERDFCEIDGDVLVPLYDEDTLSAAVAAEREKRHDLTIAFKTLDALGFIQSLAEEDDAQCQHWLGIARAALKA